MRNILAKNLKKFRTQKNMTQEQAAEMLKVSAQTVSRWECGTTLPDADILPEVARLYCVTVDDLFSETSTAYENYAQRLASVYETTNSPEDFIRAEREFRRVMKGEPSGEDLWTYGWIYHNMALCCAEKALEIYDGLLTDEKADANAKRHALYQKMDLLSKLGRAAESVKEREAELKTAPNDVKRWEALIVAYIFANDREKAYDCFRKAIVKFPGEWELYLHVGDICSFMDRYDEAFEHWNRALEIEPNLPDAMYSKAFAFEKLDENEKAKDTWNGIADMLAGEGLDVEAGEAMANAKRIGEKIKKL